MARTTSKGLYVWDSSTDSFNHTQLAANWDTIDSYLAGFDSTSKLPKRVQLVTSVPGSGTAGDVCMLTATNGGFQPYTLLKYDGTNWRPVGYEIVPAIPTSGLFAGRVVVLSAAASTFNAWDMIRYDGSSWTIVGGLNQTSTGGGSNNISGLSTSGDIAFTTGSRGIVFPDRTTGQKYRVYIDNGGLFTEKVS